LHILSKGFSPKILVIKRHLSGARMINSTLTRLFEPEQNSMY
jgi:hypothetical protein